MACPLYVSARGLTTRGMRFGKLSFEIDFDFIARRTGHPTSDRVRSRCSGGPTAGAGAKPRRRCRSG
ncbi:MAG: DUF5996 family protein [Gaiellaceae bacterium]